MKRILLSLIISFLMLGGLALGLTRAGLAAQETQTASLPIAAPDPAQPAPFSQEDQASPPAGAAQSDGASQASQIQAALGLELDAARNAGPQAVLDFVQARSSASVGLSTEAASLLDAAALDAQTELAGPSLSQAAAPLATPYVGINSGACAYTSVQAAVNAAGAGDLIKIVTGAYTETIDLAGKQLTIVGGYNPTCTTPTSGRSQIKNGAAGSVVDVTLGSRTTLRNLEISNGSSFGAGLDLLGSSHIILDNSLVHDNNGATGGGAYIGGGSVISITNNTAIFKNTANAGGGVIVYGRLAGLQARSDIYQNSSTTDGGGLYIIGGTVTLNGTIVFANTAVRNGGGVYSADGNLTMQGTARVGLANFTQTAVDGGGIYASGSSIQMIGAAIAVINNTASNNGGGLFLTNRSTLTVEGGTIGSAASATAGNDALFGGGMYVFSSTVNFTGFIINNIASGSGGGVYADSATVFMNGATIGSTSTNGHNQIGPAGLNGAGMYLINKTRADLTNSNIVSNTLSNPSTGYGGGLYVRANSIVTLTNSTIQQHRTRSSSDGRGAGIYIYDSQVTLDNSDVLSNTTPDLGGGVRMFGLSTIKINNGSTFRANQATGGVGGAIAATSTPTILGNQAVFRSNHASQNGGAIFTDGGEIKFTGSIDMQGNSAGGSGGALAVTGATNVEINASTGSTASSLSYNTAGGSGGAVYLNTSLPFVFHNNQTVHPLTISNNHSGGSGGAFYLLGAALFDVYGYFDFINNTAVGNGGAIALEGGRRIWLDDYFTVGARLSGNQAVLGGAIYASASNRVECDGARFGESGSGNQAASGGAVYLTSSVLTSDNCIFEYNTSTGSGGALAAFTSTLTIGTDYLALPDARQLAEDAALAASAAPAAPAATGCLPLTSTQCSRFNNNSATGASANGGAIFLSASILTLDNIYLHHNQATAGGAIFQTGAASKSNLRNFLVYKNSTTQAFGAGIRMSGGAYTITHGTMAYNTGGAGLSTGSVSRSVVKNSIIWRNSVGAFAAVTETSCNFDQAGILGTALNPRFLNPAADNYHLSSSSPAIDVCASGLPFDLENRPRPSGALFDMGALEGMNFALFLPLTRR